MPLKAGRPAERPGERATTFTSMPRISLPPRVRLTGAEINKHNVYIHELDNIKKHHNFLSTGGYISPYTTDLEAASKDVVAAMEKLNAEYDQVEIMENPCYNNHEYDEYMVLVNRMPFLNGSWWYAYIDCLEHPPMMRDAMLSALWLINRMGFWKITDTQFWESYTESACERYDDKDPEDDEPRLAYEKLVKFYEKEPIKLKWNPRAFHYYSSRNTALGDWLRVIWHHRKTQWFDFVPWYLQDEDLSELSAGDLFGIIYDRDDDLTAWMDRDLECSYQEYGDIGFADLRVITQNFVVHEPILKSKEERDKLGKDFEKLWSFDLKNLEYMQLYEGYYPHRMPSKKPEINKEYDYKRPTLRAKVGTDSVRSRRGSHALRRTNKSRRKRRRARVVSHAR